MSAPQHTPGPWRFGLAYAPERGAVSFDYDAPGYYDNAGIIAADGTTVVGCDEYNVFNSPADARLLTAAPELLAACIKSAAQFRFYERQHRAKSTPDADAKAEVNAALASEIEALIAKATT